jgi:hypothetical protein
MSVPPPRITGMEVAARNDLTQALDDAVFLMAAASAEALEFVASCDDKNLWSRDGATFMTSWLAGRYGWPGGRPGSGSGWPTPSGSSPRSPRPTPPAGCPGTSSVP